MSEDVPNPGGGAQRTPYITATKAGEMEDAAVLKRVQSGDQDAMQVFFDRYSRMVYSVALRVLKDSAKAEEVMQEIFVQVWRSPGAFISGRGSMSGWLLMMARNRAIDVLRRRRPSTAVEVFALPVDTNVETKRMEPAEQAALASRVRLAMAALPDEQKKLLEPAFFEGLTHSEMAERTGEPLATVKTRIRLALTTIGKALNA